MNDESYNGRLRQLDYRVWASMDREVWPRENRNVILWRWWWWWWWVELC